MLGLMKAERLFLTRTRINSVGVIMIFVLFFSTLWAAFYGLHVFSPFSYERLKSAIWISIAVAIMGLIVWLVFSHTNVARFLEKGGFIKATGWLSVILALDSWLIEPYVDFMFPRLDLDYSLRWQFQLVIAGLLALVVAIARRSWRWLPFSFLATTFGILWLIGVLAPE
jgi:hypothetical protein